MQKKESTDFRSLEAGISGVDRSNENISLTTFRTACIMKENLYSQLLKANLS